MRRTISNAFYLSMLLLAPSIPPCMAQTPSIAPSHPFSIPLTDNTTGTAVLLPAPNGQAYLVCSTPTGKITFWTMTPSNNPTPPTPPPVTPPPVPPTPPKPTIATIVTVTAEEKASLPAAVASFAANAQISFNAYTVAQVAEPSPPAAALTWIGRTAGKIYPYTFVTGSDGTTLWQGTTPTSETAFLDVLRTLQPATATPGSMVRQPSTCPTGRDCGVPLLQRRRSR